MNYLEVEGLFDTYFVDRDYEKMEELLKKGFNANHQIQNGPTYLQLACENNMSCTPFSSILRVMRNQKEKMNVKELQKLKYPPPDFRTMKLLIDYKADPNFKNTREYNMTALFYYFNDSSNQIEFQFVKYLIDHKADPNSRTSIDGLTPFMTALKNCNTTHQIIKYLIEEGKAR